MVKGEKIKLGLLHLQDLLKVINNTFTVFRCLTAFSSYFGLFDIDMLMR